MLIDQHIPALAKDRLNAILLEQPQHQSYVLNILTEFNQEIKLIMGVNNTVFQTKAIKLFTAARKQAVNDSGVSEAVRTHLLNVLQTLGNIKLRDIAPKYAVIDNQGKLLSKWYRNVAAAIKYQQRLLTTTGNNYTVISWNLLREWQYEQQKKIYKHEQ